MVAVNNYSNFDLNGIIVDDDKLYLHKKKIKKLLGKFIRYLLS